MKRRSTVAAVITATIAMSIAATAVSAFAGVTNGNFEAGTHTSASFDPLVPGDTQLTGWTVEAGSIEWIGSYWQPSEGSRSVDLNGLEAGTLSQTIGTTTGNTYTMTFDLSANPECGLPVKTLTVQASGAVAEAFAYDTAATGNTVIDMKWETRTYSFVATSPSTKLTFTSTTSGVCGPALDDVVVTEAVAPPPPPEPVPGDKADCRDDGWLTIVDRNGNGFKNQGDCVSYVASDGRNPGTSAATVGESQDAGAATSTRAEEAKSSGKAGVASGSSRGNAAASAHDKDLVSRDR
jgi:choice-of-anchor C domain-containing protein